MQGRRIAVRALLWLLLVCIEILGVLPTERVLATTRVGLSDCYRSQSAKGEPVAYPALYRLAHGQWTCTHTLRLGDRALFVLRWKWRPSFSEVSRGWAHPSARLLIRQQGIHGILGPDTVGREGLLYVGPLRSMNLPGGMTRFTLAITIPHKLQWVGHPSVSFMVAKGSAPSHFTNSSALYGFSLDPAPSILAS